ncbi:MAG: 3-hydroxy-2-methylbutyryl-CoA dehydrogenase [Gammaproteobacteria bacterium RIFCSPHIGHO2_12_38_15]|nr:MAG: 3-hydroxy-2-methylbutyryl-CoA dehydrogenase [Gammaproteobacteria bacterium RIFCSPHIGHO2_12_38_15]
MEIINKTVVITGGASGLGAACAYQLSLSGAKIAILDTQIELAQKIAKETRGLAFSCDVTQPSEIEKAFSEIQSQLGEARIIINCAGIAPAKRLVGRDGPLPTEVFTKTIQINLIGTFNVMREAAQRMSTFPWSDKSQSCGVIINTASIAAFDGQIGQVPYSASKGGVAAMTLPAARELAQFGIRVVAIAPGIFATPMLLSMPQQVQDSLSEQVPFPKRLGQPQEFAQLVQQIIQNEMLNACVIRLDGGIRMQAK